MNIGGNCKGASILQDALDLDEFEDNIVKISVNSKLLTNQMTKTSIGLIVYCIVIIVMNLMLKMNWITCRIILLKLKLLITKKVKMTQANCELI